MSKPRPSQDNLPRLLVCNRNFVLLWAAYGISAIGDHLSEMALLKESGGMARDDVTRVQALMTFSFFLPFVLLGPLAGWWADRFSRQRTMVVSDLIRASIMLSISVAVPFLLNAGWGDYGVALPLLLTGAFAAFFSPCRQAMVPTLIRDDQLVRANALISALGTIGGILSGLLGGLLVDWASRGHFGLHWNYWLDALTFVLSALLLSGIAMSRSRAVPHQLAPGVLTPVRDGFRYVAQHRRILQVILLGTVFWAAAGVVISVVPAIVREVFHGNYAAAGMYRGLIGAGIAIGAALLTILGPTVPLQLVVLASVAGGAAWLFALDVVFVLRAGSVLTAVCLVMIGVHGAGILVSMLVVIQRFVPDTRRGRIFGVSDMATMAAIVASTAVLGLPHVPHLDRYIPVLLAVIGGALVVTFVVAWRIYRRRAPRFSPQLWIIWLFVRLYAHFWLRTQRVGPCTVPTSGPVMLAINHTCGIDPMVICATMPHRLPGFVVEEKYYRVPVAHWFMRQVDCLPLNRLNPQTSFLKNAMRMFQQGRCVAIFPQGTFVAPAEPEPPAKAGVGLLALRSGATVIPAHISGTRYTYNPFVAFFKRHRARIRYGPPIDLSAFQAVSRDRDTPQRVAALIMERIQALAPSDADN